MSDFKVIKEFGLADFNDVFCYDEDNDTYVLCMTYSNGDYKVLEDIKLVPSIVDILAKEGYLEEIKAEPIITPEANKLKSITDFVYQQIENCKKDNTSIAKKFENGEIQPCVKVESDTVYYNLLKVLNHIKDIINE